MRKLVKLAITAAILTTSFAGAARDASACLQVCTLKCLPGTHCVIDPCAHCVRN
jgi:hypothetical protein